MTNTIQATRARYSVVVLGIGLAVLSYMQRVAISQAAGPIARDLHIRSEQMGLIFGAFGLSYALFEIPMGLSSPGPPAPPSPEQHGTSHPSTSSASSSEQAKPAAFPTSPACSAHGSRRASV